MDPKYITIHNTGNSRLGANDKMHTDYVDNVYGYVSWHLTIDGEEIYQELPFDESSWNAGDGNTGTGNRQSIAIEICEVNNYEKALENAISVIKFLMSCF